MNKYFQKNYVNAVQYTGTNLEELKEFFPKETRFYKEVEGADESVLAVLSAYKGNYKIKLNDWVVLRNSYEVLPDAGFKGSYFIDPEASQSPLSPNEFLEEMKKLSTLRAQDRDYVDIEGNHRKADQLMCDVLSSLGYSDGVGVFKEMNKWYS